MTDHITVRGLVATDPKFETSASGVEHCSFRLASTKRRFDKATGIWVEGEVNWYTIIAFRNLARNIAESIDKGQRILVTGKLQVRDWDNGEKHGTAVEILATSLGADLVFGTSTFERRSPMVIDPDDEESETDFEHELQPV